MRVREIKKYRDHKAICSMDPGFKFSMCSESRIHKIIQVSWFRHNGTWFHSSTNFRANRLRCNSLYLCVNTLFFALLFCSFFPDIIQLYKPVHK